MPEPTLPNGWENLEVNAPDGATCFVCRTPVVGSEYVFRGSSWQPDFVIEYAHRVCALGEGTKTMQESKAMTARRRFSMNAREIADQLLATNALRWRVSTDTTTEPPVLEQCWLDADDKQIWRPVPTEVTDG